MSICIICNQDESIFALDHKHQTGKIEPHFMDADTLEEEIQALSRKLKAKREHMRTKNEQSDDWMYTARCPGCYEEKLLRIDRPICQKCEVYAHTRQGDCQCDCCLIQRKADLMEKGASKR